MTEFAEVKTQDLSGVALDWVVAQIDEVKTMMLRVQSQEAKKPFALFGSLALPVGSGEEGYSPSTCWHCGGPLIEKLKIGFGPARGGWVAHPNRPNEPTDWLRAEAPLVAICRAIVADKLGMVVSVPKELLS